MKILRNVPPSARSALLPNLLTIGNGVCGYAALVKLSSITYVNGTLINAVEFKWAAYLILLGMIFDVFDGKIARTFGGGSELGGQLDSLCDLITFGLVPAFMIVQLNLTDEPTRWQQVVWGFGLVYFLGALLRLARFNVENAPDESAHLAFKGLPSPAAAGVVASLVILQRYVLASTEGEIVWFRELVGVETMNTAGLVIGYIVTFLGPVLAFTMVADRVKFAHAGTHLFGRLQSFDFQVYVIFTILFIAFLPEIILPLSFVGYFLWTPISGIKNVRTRHQEKKQGMTAAGGKPADDKPAGDKPAEDAEAPVAIEDEGSDKNGRP